MIDQPFSLGNRILNNPYFNKDVYLHTLVKEPIQITNVTFEAGCLNNWHIHHKGGQILLVTAGEGWYQEWGKPAQKLTAGDVVNISAEVKHWHGAARNSEFAHIAIAVPAESAETEWCESVSEDDYNRLD